MPKNRGKIWKCQICGEGFSKIELFDEHTSTHAGGKAFKCDYPDCGKRFSAYVSVRSHKAKQHAKPNQCGWLTQGKYCHVQFGSIADLEEHVMEVHLENRNNLRCGWKGCKQGKYAFESKDALSCHQQDHTRCFVEQYLETDSGEKFDAPMAKYCCQWNVRSLMCPHHFRTASELADHLHSKHGSGIVCLWKGCQLEGQEFSNRQQFLDHMVLHHEDKRFECSDCHRTFFNKGYLKVHKRHYCANRTLRRSSLEWAKRDYEQDGEQDDEQDDNSQNEEFYTNFDDEHSNGFEDLHAMSSSSRNTNESKCEERLYPEVDGHQQGFNYSNAIRSSTLNHENSQHEKLFTGRDIDVNGSTTLNAVNDSDSMAQMQSAHDMKPSETPLFDDWGDQEFI
ncbi:unnamed protein product [Caenorhabditis brenneri]